MVVIHRLHRQLRSLHADQGLTVEIRKHSGIDQIDIRLHLDLARQKPVIKEIDCHGFRTHDRRIHIVFISLKCYELAYKRIFSTVYQKVTFLLLYLCSFPLNSLEVLVQPLRQSSLTQRIQLLCLHPSRQAQNHY